MLESSLQSSVLSSTIRPHRRCRDSVDIMLLESEPHIPKSKKRGVANPPVPFDILPDPPVDILPDPPIDILPDPPVDILPDPPIYILPERTPDPMPQNMSPVVYLSILSFIFMN